MRTKCCDNLREIGRTRICLERIQSRQNGTFHNWTDFRNQKVVRDTTPEAHCLTRTSGLPRAAFEGVWNKDWIDIATFVRQRLPGIVTVFRTTDLLSRKSDSNSIRSEFSRLEFPEAPILLASGFSGGISLNRKLFNLAIDFHTRIHRPLRVRARTLILSSASCNTYARTRRTRRTAYYHIAGDYSEVSHGSPPFSGGGVRAIDFSVISQLGSRIRLAGFCVGLGQQYLWLRPQAALEVLRPLRRTIHFHAEAGGHAENAKYFHFSAALRPRRLFAWNLFRRTRPAGKASMISNKEERLHDGGQRTYPDSGD